MSATESGVTRGATPPFCSRGAQSKTPTQAPTRRKGSTERPPAPARVATANTGATDSATSRQSSSRRMLRRPLESAGDLQAGLRPRQRGQRNLVVGVPGQRLLGATLRLLGP